jgi:tetratricopeptide (TPR) repeat protein
MKITGLKKSFPIFASFFVSAVVFAMVVAYQQTSSQAGQGIPHSGSNTAYDTIPTAKSNQKDSLFNAYLSAADRFYNEKDYENSQAELKKALQLRPQDNSLRERINKMNGLVSTQKELKDASQKSIASGDGYFKSKDYLNAKASYQLAVSQNPNDEVAKEKLRRTLDLLRSQKAQNILFDVAVASADKLFQAGDYAKAKLEYENASKLLPGDPYPKNKINEIIKIQVDNQVKEEEYTRAIASADRFLQAKNFQNALLDYRKAAGIKPDEKYPQDRIKEITSLLDAQKAKDDAYNKAIASGDQLFKAIQYPEAIKAYTDARNIKPDQAYPREKIKEIEGIIARNAKAQADYDKYISQADSFYIGKQYFKARENYVMASSVKPAESYPKEMISKADKMLTGQEALMAKALDEQYAKTIVGADKLLADKSYEPARAEFVKASNLKPSEQYPKDKIAEIEIIIANALKDKEAMYATMILAGDKAYAARLYESAKTEFQHALAIKPNEVYPKTKIGELDKLISAEAQQKAADARYANSIGKADSMFMVKDYLPARSEFQNASNMKPAEVYPKNKIIEIDQILAALEKLKLQDAQYAGLIAKADKLFAEKSYQPARTAYVNASAMKPSESYPKERILEIDKILGDLAAVKALDAQYTTVIANADKLFAAKTYDQAKIEYTNASNLKPAEQYPKDKLAGIEKILADLAAKNTLDQNYQASLTKADQYFTDKAYAPAKSEYENASRLKPTEQYPKTKMAEIDVIFAAGARQKAVEEDYNADISKGEKLLAEKTYEPALAAYQAALKLKPAEEYPKGKIGEINQVLADLEKQKSLDTQYNGMVLRADKLLTEKSFVPARTEYLNASKLKPQESYPRDKITDIDKILADLATAKALDEQYAGIIANADHLLVSKSYEPAKIEYQKAGAVKPAEAYPSQKIAEIDKILTDLAAAKSIDENYQAAISMADNHLAEKDYVLAKSEYVKASGLKPAEKYPVTKITEIETILAGIARQKALDDEYNTTIMNADKLLAEKSFELSKTQYLAALKIKPVEKYPKDKIAEIDKSLAELAVIKNRDDKYAALVANADKLLSQKSFNPAKAAYLNALSVKPQESYPKEKIAEIEAALVALATAKELDDKYNGIIANADKLLTSKTYDQAKAEYQNAGKLKPSETYPSQKIAEIDKILSEIAAAKTLDENYLAAVTSADKHLLEKNYDLAKSEYSKASTIKPAEKYPITKIAEIDAALNLIAKQKALEEEYAAIIAGADKLLSDKVYEQAKIEYQKAVALKADDPYPKGKLAEIEKALSDIARLRAVDEQYAAAIAGADKLLQEKSYEQAKTSFIEAGKIKPAEKYPQEKINEITAIIAANAKQKSLDDQYNAAIAKGDQLLASKTWDQAKIEYTNALSLKPSEQYAQDKIKEIDGVLAEMKAREDAYKTSVETADQLFAQKKYEEARTGYQNALVLKPQATYPKEKIAEINKALEELLGKQKYYENLVTDADNALKDKDYAKAKEVYQQALGVFPDQPYPKNQISLITAKVDSLYRANKSFYDKAITDGDRSYNAFEFDKAIDAYTEAANFLPMEKYPREMIVKIRKTIAENAIVDILKTSVTITSNNEKQFAFEPVNIASRKNNFVYIKIKNLSGKPFNVLMRYGKDKQANGGVVMRNLNIDGKVNERLVSVKDQDLWSREDNNWISLYPQGGDVEVSFIQVSKAK